MSAVKKMGHGQVPVSLARVTSLAAAGFGEWPLPAPESGHGAGLPALPSAV